MASPSSKSPPTGYPDFGVRQETICSFFHPPMARSTFHDFVNKGKIIPMKSIRGFYLLNASLSRLGLREVLGLGLVDGRNPWLLSISYDTGRSEISDGRRVRT